MKHRFGNILEMKHECRKQVKHILPGETENILVIAFLLGLRLPVEISFPEYELSN